MRTNSIASILCLFTALPFLSACIALASLNPDDGGSVPAEALLALGVGGSGTAVGGGTAGPAGNSITSTDGRFTILIPEGAVDGQQEFTITRYTPATNALPGGFLPTTPVYEVTPSYRFKKDVTVSMVLDTNQIQALNLGKQKSSGFSFSATSPTDDAARFPDWMGHDSRVEGDKLVFSTRTFSLFGGGSPPPGNLPPTILGSFYYFKPNCSYVPYRVRARVVEPDGDSMTVRLITGPAGGGTNLISMTREGVTDWYQADIPYEAMVPGGIVLQITATDSFGNNTTRPTSGVFTFPASTGNPVYISNYNRDQDGDGYLDAWEVDNGFDPTNASVPAAVADTDGDGIPDTADNTPNGEINPQIDTLTVFPDQVAMDVNEQITFGVSASFGGQPRFVNASFATSGTALDGTPVGALTGSVLLAEHPGTAGVTATVGALNAVAAITVNDTIGPNNITSLSATVISHTQIRLQWSAPGNDGPAGKAAVYEIRSSTTPIADDAACDAASTIAHSLSPKNFGLAEQLDVNGLSPSTTYHFCIRAFDAQGNRNSWAGAAVTTVTQAVPDIIAPSDVTGATATVLGGDSIQLNWVAVGDDGGIGSAASYEIRRSTTPINNDTDCDGAINVVNTVPATPAGTPLNFAVTGLSGNTIYHFCIRPYDDVNNRGAWSGVLTATTPVTNTAPTASAGPNQTVGLALSANLDGSSSVDPDAAFCGANTGNYVYQWSLAAKPPTSTLTNGDITGANSTSASFTPDVIGDYTLQFSFTDDPGSCGGGAKVTLSQSTVTVTALVGGGVMGPLTLTGTVSTFAGSGAVSGTTDGIGSAARFNAPAGITTDGTNLYVADFNNHTIRKIVIATGAVTTFAGSAGIRASVDGTGTAARFDYPYGITTDGQYLFVATSGGRRIRRIEISTAQVTTLSTTGSSTGQLAAVVRVGNNLYLGNQGTYEILNLDLGTSNVTPLAGLLNTPGSADGVGTAARFRQSFGLTTDGNNLYIPDSINYTIRKIVIASGVVTTIAGTAGNAGSADGIGAAASFDYPALMATDGPNLYITEWNNSIVRKMVIATGDVTTLAGSPGLTGTTDGVGSAARFNRLRGIVSDGTSLFVADSYNHTIRKID